MKYNRKRNILDDFPELKNLRILYYCVSDNSDLPKIYFAIPDKFKNLQRITLESDYTYYNHVDKNLYFHSLSHLEYLCFKFVIGGYTSNSEKEHMSKINELVSYFFKALDLTPYKSFKCFRIEIRTFIDKKRTDEIKSLASSLDLLLTKIDKEMFNDEEIGLLTHQNLELVFASNDNYMQSIKK